MSISLKIKHLWDEYPLFMPWLDVSMADFEDLVAKTLPLPSILQKSDPVSFFVPGKFLYRALQTEDDGSASFLLDGRRIARCNYWWGWFISKMKRVTRYCDQVTDGFPSKKCDSQFKRNLVASDSRFDSGASYPETMQVLDLGAAEPE